MNKWRISKQLLNFFAPGCCLLCDALVTDGFQLCQGCAADGPYANLACQYCGRKLQKPGAICICSDSPRFLDRILAVRAYLYPVNSLVQQMKYRGQLGLCREFGIAIADLARATSVTMPECLIPVPMHRSRLRERGYNQALEIARVVADRLRLPLEPSLCRRVRPTVPQYNLNPEARARNVRGAFVAHKVIHYAHIAIIDDVFTTGATVIELAKQLRKAEVRQVELWSYAIVSR